MIDPVPYKTLIKHVNGLEQGTHIKNYEAFPELPRKAFFVSDVYSVCGAFFCYLNSTLITLILEQ